MLSCCCREFLGKLLRDVLEDRSVACNYADYVAWFISKERCMVMGASITKVMGQKGW